MKGKQMFTKSPIHIATVLALGVFAFSGAVFAHQAMNEKTVESTPVPQAKVESASTQITPPPISTPVTTEADPCTKTITQSTDSSNGNSTNVKSTDVHCQSHTDSSNTSVDINNSTHQSATTGDSTGQSGTASNSDTTHINVNH